ncbi:hypothetical protein NHX12_015621 [Muraenolepis orangiensis]|uniref:Uncharacterized protein n=1 Tax=Muraenolepis orangiensis TaxID=630683 RepID=A0A9Q0D861_9TELE|nr:hypothetical protein NHX12_015621 [Muraenolepis orangiensis]
MLPCNHEDTRIMFHQLDALEHGSSACLVHTVDTDVVVKFHALLTKYPAADIWVAFGTSWREMFCQKNRMMEHIPPTQDSLLQHLKRVAYQSGIWATSELAQQRTPSPDGNGLTLDRDSQRSWTCPPDSTLHQRSWTCSPDSTLNQMSWTCPHDSTLHQRSWTCPPDSTLHQRTWTCSPDSTLHQRSWTCPPDSTLHQRSWTCPPDSTLHQRSWTCPPDSYTRGAGPVLLTPLYTRGDGPVLLTPLYTRGAGPVLLTPTPEEMDLSS